ncbi:hypothetical protein [Saccharothrix australiensis]|uniref:Secreted protein n=1 Tax=Saccharothrix australiensis TaxID=2072 RepID=A0A495W0M7_9PSEU|nr:hypothetical protein [Saccharothrix australiensis]RKT55251.1 hypothetical protein C8E97_3910 [Saccharothrix australiensis]
MRNLRFTDWVFVVAAVAIVLAGALTLFRPAPGPAHSAHQRAAPADLAPAAHSDGLSEAESGYRFERVTVPDRRGDAVPVAFRIIGPDGRARTGFRENQTKQLHFFAVRDDMHVFQHVHPTLVGDTWHTTLALPDGGAYRMFAEFVPHDTEDPRHPVVLGVPFSVPGDTGFVPVPAPGAEAVTDSGFTVVRVDEPAEPTPLRPQELRFAIRTPDGEPVRTLDPHLGAHGHMTGFHTMLLSATHLHPVEPPGAPLVNGELTFQAVFADLGEYRLFLEFSHGGRVHTASFTVAVT